MNGHRGERQPRADRIGVDFSWSDQDDLSWSEPRQRRAPRSKHRNHAPQPVPGDRAGAASEPLAGEASSHDFAAAIAAFDRPSEAAVPPPAAHTRQAGVAQNGQPARRTVVIKGRGPQNYAPARGGYEARLRPHERTGFKPDRVALWAVLLGLALLLGAVTSSHAASLHAVHSALLHHAAVHGSGLGRHLHEGAIHRA